MKVALLFCSDILPRTNSIQTSGGSLRSEQLRKELAAGGFDVVCAMPRGSLLVRTQSTAIPATDHPYLYDVGNEIELIASLKPAVVVWAWPLMAQIPVSGLPSITSVLDLNGFQNFESAASSGDNIEQITEALIRRAHQADIVLYGSLPQQAYWEGLLSLAYPGRRSPKSVVFPYYTRFAHQKEYRRTNTFFYIGSILPWISPFKALRSLARIVGSIETAQLRIFTSTQPGSLENSDYKDFVRQISSLKNVHIERPKSAIELYEEIGYSGIGFDLLEESFERRFALPIRTINYLTHGIPLIYNDYSALSRDIELYSAGWTTSNADEAVRAIVLRSLDATDEELRAKSKAASILACEKFQVPGEGKLCEMLELHLASSHSANYVVPKDMKSNLNVLVISDDSESILRLRLVAPLEALFHAKLISAYVVVGSSGIRYSSRRSSEDLEINVVVVQRVPKVSTSFIISQTAGCFIYDIDDLLIGTPSYRPPFPADFRHKVRSLLAASSTVSLTTSFLARALAIYSGIDVSAKARLLPNPLVRRKKGVGFARPEAVLISSSDSLALGQSANAVFDAVAQTCRREGLGLTYIGPYPDAVLSMKVWKSIDVRTANVRSYSEYLDFIEGGRFMAAVPLETKADQGTLDFIAAKSDIKAVEFLGLGVPSVFSEAAPYRYSDLEIPYVIPNDRDVWSALLDNALQQTDQERRDRADGVSSARWIGGDFKLSWLSVLEDNVLRKSIRLNAFLEGMEKFSASLQLKRLPGEYFDEEYYLKVNPDVARAVQIGEAQSGRSHYEAYGRNEGRRISPFESEQNGAEHADEAVSALMLADSEMNAIDHRISQIERKLSKYV